MARVTRSIAPVGGRLKQAQPVQQRGGACGPRPRCELVEHRRHVAQERRQRARQRAVAVEGAGGGSDAVEEEVRDEPAAARASRCAPPRRRTPRITAPHAMQTVAAMLAKPARWDSPSRAPGQ